MTIEFQLYNRQILHLFFSSYCYKKENKKKFFFFFLSFFIYLFNYFCQANTIVEKKKQQQFFYTMWFLFAKLYSILLLWPYNRQKKKATNTHSHICWGSHLSTTKNRSGKFKSQILKAILHCKKIVHCWIAKTRVAFFLGKKVTIVTVFVVFLFFLLRQIIHIVQP